MRRRLTPSGPQLSPREREVLQLLADGLGVAAIARQLYISESTTKTHISKLYEKLGAANRAQALMAAMVVVVGILFCKAIKICGHFCISAIIKMCMQKMARMAAAAIALAVPAKMLSLKFRSEQ